MSEESEDGLVQEEEVVGKGIGEELRRIGIGCKRLDFVFLTRGVRRRRLCVLSCISVSKACAVDADIEN